MPSSPSVAAINRSENLISVSLGDMRVAKRIPFFTQPCRRLPPKIPNPLPKTTSGPITTEGKCVFYDLRAKASGAPENLDQLPPLLPNPVGRIMSQGELNRMRQLRTENPKRWTITALAAKFNIHRSYIIKNVLTKTEQLQAKEELLERIDRLTFAEKRGWLMRYKIREHRRDLV